MGGCYKACCTNGQIRSCANHFASEGGSNYHDVLVICFSQVYSLYVGQYSNLLLQANLKGISSGSVPYVHTLRQVRMFLSRSEIKLYPRKFLS